MGASANEVVDRVPLGYDAAADGLDEGYDALQNDAVLDPSSVTSRALGLPSKSDWYRKHFDKITHRPRSPRSATTPVASTPRASRSTYVADADAEGVPLTDEAVTG